MSNIRGTIRAWWDRVCPLLPGEPSQLDRADGVGRVEEPKVSPVSPAEAGRRC